jgi:hypothetical protein
MKDLLNEKKIRISRVSAGLLSDEVDKVKEDLEWLSLFESLCERKTNRLKILWVFIIGFLSISLITLGFIIKTRTVNFKGDFLVDKLKLNVSEEWLSSNPILCNQFDANNLAGIESNGMNIHHGSTKIYSLSIKGDNLFIQDLFFSKNSEVSIKYNGSKLELVIKYDSITASIDCSDQSKILISDDSRQLKYGNMNNSIERVRINSKRVIEDPIQISLDNVKTWSINDIRPSSIDFNDEYVGFDDIVQIRSSLFSGEIQLLETGLNHTLEEGDFVKFSVLELRRLRISSHVNKIKISAEGSASEIFAGPEGFEKKLNPSLVDYLFHEKRVALFYSGAVFLWGVLWGIRNLFLVKKIL